MIFVYGFTYPFVCAVMRVSKHMREKRNEERGAGKREKNERRMNEEGGNQMEKKRKEGRKGGGGDQDAEEVAGVEEDGRG